MMAAAEVGSTGKVATVCATASCGVAVWGPMLEQINSVLHILASVVGIAAGLASIWFYTRRSK